MLDRLRLELAKRTQPIRVLATRALAFRRLALPYLRGETLMLTLAVAVGLGTGLLAALLIEAIAFVQRLAFGTAVSWPMLLIVPSLGALMVGLVMTYVVPESSGSGVVRVMSTISLRGGRFRMIVPFAGVLATSLALGTGASGGREGPIVLIGGSLGSLLGRVFAVGEERMRTLVAAGAAAGVGASFNAPIAGMLFAIELIIGGFRSRSLQVVVVSSVVGSVTAREVIGPDIIYEPAVQYTFRDPRELALYAVLGLTAALFGVAFIHGEDIAKRFFGGLSVWWPLRLGLGGLGVGVIALVVPEVIGTGAQLPPIDGIREPIQTMLDGGPGTGYPVVGFLLLLAVAKLVATCLSIGSGNAVGTFAPTIVCGAAVGGALGHVAAALLPGAEVQPGAFALVGMAAVFAAAVRAPLTAIVIAFELTGGYQLVLPLMLATGLATFIADRMQPDSVYTLPLRRRGIVYAEPEDIDIMQTIKVGEIMTAEPHTLPADMTLDQAREAFRRTRHHGFPVIRDGRLVGVITLADLARVGAEFTGDLAEAAGGTGLTVGDVCTRQPLTVTPDDPVFLALRRMAMIDVGRVPVVASDDHARLVGLVRRSDLVKAYQRAVNHHLAAQQRSRVARLRDLAQTKLIEVRVAPGAPSAGRRVRDVAWPRRTILTSIRREDDIIMPNGDTELGAGDEVTVLTDQESVTQVRDLLAGGEDATRPPDI